MRGACVALVRIHIGHGLLILLHCFHTRNHFDPILTMYEKDIDHMIDFETSG